MFRRRRAEPATGAGPWRRLQASRPDAASLLDRLVREQELSDVDFARIRAALARLGAEGSDARLLADEILATGPSTAVHRSRQRDLPGTRLAQHNLVHGQVRLGRVVPTPHSSPGATTDFGVDHDVLRTSLLVVGPPGSGKTRGFALPIVEHLSLSALTNQASVVVVDPKGDDFDLPGWFDVTVDPLAPTAGFDLYGGSASPEVAADRLASALLPPNVSEDLAYFMDASRNALYACLAPFHQALGRWPSIRELLALLRSEQGMTDRVKAGLKGSDGSEAKRLLDTRASQGNARTDPAASLVERLGLLDRPHLTRLFDHAEPKFRMRDLNAPLRVRIALPEAELPDASRILARLVVSQFVQLTSAADTNRAIFKALVIDEAGRFVDDYVARGVQKLRSNNAGLILLAQTISDFPAHVRATVLGSVGCKAVFGGVDPADAEIFSRWFGSHWAPDVTRSRHRGETVTDTPDGMVIGGHTGYGSSSRLVERSRWSTSDIVTGLPPGHCVAAVSRSTGERSGPLLVDLRA